MTIDKPAVALRSIVVVHPTCPARCILPAISRAGNQTTRDAHERSHPRVFSEAIPPCSQLLELPFRNH